MTRKFADPSVAIRIAEALGIEDAGFITSLTITAVPNALIEVTTTRNLTNCEAEELIELLGRYVLQEKKDSKVLDS